MAAARKALLARFLGAFPKDVSMPRTIGREAEFPVVDTISGEAGDVQRLLRRVEARAAENLPGGRLTADHDALVTHEPLSDGTGERISGIKMSSATEFAIEVGTGTVELITGPFTDLHSLQYAHEQSVGVLLRAAEDEGMSVLGHGLQPLTPPSLDLMTTRPRYVALLDLLGSGWLWFASTASDQVHVDTCREELPMLVSVCNAVTPVVVALCGNSGVAAGGLTDFCCAREGQMGEISKEVARHGMPLRPVATMEQWFDEIVDLDFLLHRTAPEAPLQPAFVSGGNELRSFGWHLDQMPPGADPTAPDAQAWQDFLCHEHYVWHSARPRCKQSTIEIRAACQQPGDSHMAASALALGLVEAAPAILGALTGEKPPPDAASCVADWPTWHARLEKRWPNLVRLHEAAVTHGLQDDEVAELCASVLRCCARGLDQRRLGEDQFLEPLFGRLSQRRNPAQLFRHMVQVQGVDELIKSARLRA